MSRRAVATTLALAACAMGLGWGMVRAQDREGAATRDDARLAEPATAARLAVAARPSADYAYEDELARVTEASGREAAIERARRVAPVDLTWGDW